MKLTIERKVSTIVAELCRKSRLSKIFDHAGNDISNDEDAHCWSPAKVGTINFITENDDSLSITSLQFENEIYMKISTRCKVGSKLVEGPVVRENINEYFEYIMKNNSESFIKKLKNNLTINFP